uniref:hypothetical protein n=1 Tax=Candidatus Electrothrix sp. TaxID=2170559 RepID=UPI0040561227
MRRYFVTILMLFLVMLLLDSSSWATESDIIGEGGQAGLEESVREVDKFNYQFGDRPDPFLPFLSKDNSRDELDDTDRK